MRYLFCVGMFRAGSTWQYNVASQLAESHLGGVRLGFFEAKRFTQEVDAGLHTHLLMTLKAHDRHPAYLPVLESGVATLIYAHRDVRDVAYSFMHKAKLDFQDLVATGFFQRVLENDAFWRGQRWVLVQRYDDLINEPVKAVGQIAGHIGVRLSQDEARRVAADHSWDANLNRTVEVRRKAAAEGLDLDHPDHVFEHDPHSLLHWNHLREGRATTGWRQRSTPEERALFAEHCGPWLIANGYERDDAWVVADVVPKPATATPTPTPSPTRVDRAAGHNRPRRLIGMLSRLAGHRANRA